MTEAGEHISPRPAPEALTELTYHDIMSLCEMMPVAFSAMRPPDIVEFAPDLITESSADLLVARSPEGKIVSAMAVNVDFGIGKRRGWIDDVATHEDYRRQGYAASVLDFALEWMKERGVKRVNLTSSDDKQPAHRLYESRGFRIHDTNKFQLDL